MFLKFLLCFFVSMVPLIEVRGSMPIASGMDLPEIPSLVVCTIGNMVPVPIIYFFSRKVLIWGSDKRIIGKIFTFFLEKGEKAGRKLAKDGKKKGMFIALMLFVGLPLPGTGAWTGTLGASFLDFGIKKTSLSVCLGVIIASLIMGFASESVLAIFGL